MAGHRLVVAGGDVAPLREHGAAERRVPGAAGAAEVFRRRRCSTRAAAEPAGGMRASQRSMTVGDLEVLLAAAQCLVGDLLQPRLVRVGSVHRAGRGSVSSRSITSAKLAPGQDVFAGGGDLGAQVVEVAPRPLVHLGRVEVGAEHLAHADAVALGAAAVVGVGGGCVRRRAGTRRTTPKAALAAAAPVARPRPRASGGSVGVGGGFGGQRVEPAVGGPRARLVGGGERLTASGEDAGWARPSS